MQAILFSCVYKRKNRIIESIWLLHIDYMSTICYDK
jgi:hypothetical protein